MTSRDGEGGLTATAYSQEDRPPACLSPCSRKRLPAVLVVGRSSTDPMAARLADSGHRPGMLAARVKVAADSLAAPGVVLSERRRQRWTTGQYELRSGRPGHVGPDTRTIRAVVEHGRQSGGCDYSGATREVWRWTGPSDTAAITVAGSTNPMTDARPTTVSTPESQDLRPRRLAAAVGFGRAATRLGSFHLSGDAGGGLSAARVIAGAGTLEPAAERRE